MIDYNSFYVNFGGSFGYKGSKIGSYLIALFGPEE